MTHIEKGPSRPVRRKGRRAWILFSSGSRLNLLAPNPNAWTDEDVATGLSRTYRRSGHSSWDLPLSVAQHSLTVMALRQPAEEPVAPARGPAGAAA